MTRSGTLSLALLLSFACAVMAAPDASELLKKGYSAEKRVSVSGTMLSSLASDGQAVTAKVKIHRHGGRTRMEYLTGPSSGIVIIDDGKSLVTLYPKTRSATVCDMPGTPGRVDLLLKNHIASVLGSERVAGRDCYLVQVKPRHKGNPSEKLWIDKEYGLMLRTERYRADGRLVSGTRYEKVDFSVHLSDSLFRVPGGWKVTRSSYPQASLKAQDVRKAVGFEPAKPGYVPQGYVFDGYYVQKAPCGMLFVGMRYTNGVSTISAFQSECRCQGAMRGKGRGCPPGGRGRGRCAGSGACVMARSAGAVMFQNHTGDMVITVVGDAPEAELRKMAESFR